MECPKCRFPIQSDSIDCPRCGIVIAKFLRAHGEALEAVELPALMQGASAVAVGTDDDSAARSEWIARAAALPVAMLFAWLAVNTSPGAVRILAMWVHESGHAVAAWLCGYAAWPGPWFTPVAAQKSPSLTVLLVGALTFGGFRSWQLERWFWVTASACAVLLVLFCTLVLRPGAGQQLIVFAGDGGGLVLGTMLMLTVYARAEHPVRRDQLRWGLLVIGALAFMDVYAVWSGPYDRLPFGENENGLSDPSVLTETYGWTVVTLVNYYRGLAHACFALLIAVYLVAICRIRPQRQPTGAIKWTAFE